MFWEVLNATEDKMAPNSKVMFAAASWLFSIWPVFTFMPLYSFIPCPSFFSVLITYSTFLVDLSLLTRVVLRLCSFKKNFFNYPALIFIRASLEYRKVYLRYKFTRINIFFSSKASFTVIKKEHAPSSADPLPTKDFVQQQYLPSLLTTF